MAAEGRRDRERSNIRRRSPPPRESSYDSFRDRDRSRDRSPLDDRRRDSYRRDDPYDRLHDPRDDPYRRPPAPHPADDPYLRPPLPPTRDPYRRDPFGPPDPYFRDALPPLPFERPPALPGPERSGPERPPFDCVLILHGRQLMGYAEMVERRLKQNMMAVDIQVLLDKEAPQVLIDGATRRNIPFAAVINDQNDLHQSITINILHGTPQEHRNMPLDDAMTLVSRNFEQFVKKICEKEISTKGATNVPLVPPDGQMTYLLNLLADGRHLTLDELSKVKVFVDQRRNRLLEAEGKPTNGGSDDNRAGVPPPSMNNRPAPAPVRPGAPLSQQLQPADGHKDEVAIIKQQAELQAKILSILNTSSAPPASSAPTRGASQPHVATGHAETQSVASNRVPTLAGLRPPTQAPPQRPPQGMQETPKPQSSGGGLPLNLDNPNVQKALDNLIQSGPSLIKSISNQVNPISAGLNSSGMHMRANEQQMMQRQRGPPPPQQMHQRMSMQQQQQQQPRMPMANLQQQHMMQAQQQAAVMQMNMMQMGMRPRY